MPAGQVMRAPAGVDLVTAAGPDRGRRDGVLQPRPARLATGEIVPGTRRGRWHRVVRHPVREDARARPWSLPPGLEDKLGLLPLDRSRPCYLLPRRLGRGGVERHRRPWRGRDLGRDGRVVSGAQRRGCWRSAAGWWSSACRAAARARSTSGQLMAKRGSVTVDLAAGAAGGREVRHLLPGGREHLAAGHLRAHQAGAADALPARRSRRGAPPAGVGRQPRQDRPDHRLSPWLVWSRLRRAQKRWDWKAAGGLRMRFPAQRCEWGPLERLVGLRLPAQHCVRGPRSSVRTRLPAQRCEWGPLERWSGCVFPHNTANGVPGGLVEPRFPAQHCGRGPLELRTDASSRTTLRMGSRWRLPYGRVFPHNAANGVHWRAGRAAFSRTTLRARTQGAPYGRVFRHNTAQT